MTSTVEGDRVDDAQMIGSLTTLAGPMAASFLTGRYWEARDLRDPRQHGWFALYLGAVLVLLVAVLATSTVEDRLRAVGLFFGVTIVATLVQERRYRRQQRMPAAPETAGS
ncbi:hypothetical protein [Isoptericola sediminis]|uniref:Uncharacterized protein n=1 Tax=Isoptericola sediminis TaxID=2733572 RepID=A0A849K358_9MICO|nr:hypothetical protein [Isoptericola sediminis]NNU27698.1 hypothetical protein [Isoptericola sediminis]